MFSVKAIHLFNQGLKAKSWASPVFRIGLQTLGPIWVGSVCFVPQNRGYTEIQSRVNFLNLAKQIPLKYFKSLLAKHLISNYLNNEGS